VRINGLLLATLANFEHSAPEQKHDSFMQSNPRLGLQHHVMTKALSHSARVFHRMPLARTAGGSILTGSVDDRRPLRATAVDRRVHVLAALLCGPSFR
jgi:hypothetical protein